MSTTNEERTQISIEYPNLDYLSQKTADNFDAIIADVLERCPVVNANGAWLLTRLEDVRTAANDWETFSSAKGIIPWNDDGAHFRPSAIDPPLHPYYREPFLKHLSPRAVGPLEPLMRAQAREIIATFIDKGTCDTSTDFARIYIGNVFFEGILGLEHHVAPKMLDLMYGWLFPPYDENSVVAMAEYGAYVSEVLSSQLDVADRAPVIDALLSLEVDGEPIEWDDKCNTLSLLIVGGLETTVNAINQSLLYLSTHPDLLVELVADHSLIPAATEEFLRLFAPVVGLGRTVMRDTEVNGQPIKAGEKIMIGFGASARDPRVFDDPLSIDIHRESQNHLIFGSGIHRCLGSHFARLEIKVALEEFLTAIPTFSLDPDATLHWVAGMNREVSGVRLTF